MTLLNLLFSLFAPHLPRIVISNVNGVTATRRQLIPSHIFAYYSIRLAIPFILHLATSLL